MVVKKLSWCPTKEYVSGGKKFKISVEVSLDDDCHNMTCDFSITGTVYEKKDGVWKHYTGGCIHDSIVRHFPELKKFISLHLSNYLGQPMYPEANGQYHVRESGLKVAMEYLRCNAKEIAILSSVCDKEERQMFKYQLFKLGIVERWQKEAQEFIRFLEEKTGNVWVNPYKPEEEKFVLRMSEEERKEIESKIDSGYYTESSINERKVQRFNDAKESKRNQILEKYEEETRHSRNERDVKLYVLNSSLPMYALDNFIYYQHNNRCVFNWMESSKKITQEEFVDFINSVDYNQLPKGIKFEIK